MRWLRVSLVVAFLLTFALSVEAATTSRLEGFALDDQDRPLAGAQITISSESLIGGPQTAITTENGAFAFNFLLVGMYTVSAELVGYTPSTATARVQLDRTAKLTLSLAPVSFEGEIEVGADVPIIDPTRTNTGEVFDEEYLKYATIGSEGRSYLRIMDFAAGAIPSTPQRVFGGTQSENAYLVDGFNTTDPSTGGSATHFVFDAIEEASVLTGGISPEYGFGSGGVLNVVTKSGSNEFAGTFDARYSDQRFVESGDHFEKGPDTYKNRVLSATLGGSILRDRLWFFAAYENRYYKYTPEAAPESEVTTRNSILGKLTWAINPSNRLMARYSANPRRVENWGVGRDTTPEATSLYKNNEPIGQLELNSTLSDRLFLTVGLGFSREDLEIVPMINDFDVPSEYDDDADIRFSNPEWVELGDRDRDHHHAKLSYFVADALGTHQADAGLEYNKLHESGVSFTPGGYSIEYLNNAYQDEPWPDSDGDGLVDTYLDRDTPPETARDPRVGDAKGWAAFLQDQWRPVPEITLNLGVRYETMAHTNTIGETVADFNKWLPRLGVAWDVGGRGRHVLRAGWSRYIHPGTTNLSVVVPGVVWGTERYWGIDYLCETEEICDRAAATAEYDSEFVHIDSEGNEHYFYRNAGSSSNPAETVDTLGVGTLRVPYRDELILAYETKVAEETSFEVSYIRKDNHDQIEDTCNNNTWAWGGGEPPSLDDPSTWTDREGCTGSVRANIPGIERSYEALTLRAASRARPWFHLIGTYTYSKTRGNSLSSAPYTGFGSALGGFPYLFFDQFPTSFVNLDGNLEPDLRHFARLGGYFRFPLDFTLGVEAFYRSGQALSVYAHCSKMLYPSDSGLAELARMGIDYNEMVVYCPSWASGFIVLESQGSRRGEDVWQLDLQLSKAFRVGSVRLVGIVSVFNVFSREAPIAFTQFAFSSLGWGTPDAWQDPRRWEVGFRIEF